MEIPVGKDLEHVPGFATSKGSKGQVLFSGLRVKVGISYGIPAMRRPIQETGKAMYVGSVVQQAAHLMVTACPGQVGFRLIALSGIV